MSINEMCAQLSERFGKWELCFEHGYYHVRIYIGDELTPKRWDWGCPAIEDALRQGLELADWVS